MKSIHKKLCWFVGMPIMATVHFYVAYRMFILLFMWGEGLKPPFPWVQPLATILFYVTNPLMLVFGYIDSNLIHLADFWYDPVSFVLSAIVWWTLIIWFITTRPTGKRAV